MISLRKTHNATPEISGMIPISTLISVAASVKETYLQLPMIYIQATIVMITLLLAIGVGLIIPWWIN
jgi:hypothetical protein